MVQSQNGVTTIVHILGGVFTVHEYIPTQQHRIFNNVLYPIYDYIENILIWVPNFNVPLPVPIGD